MDWEKTAASVGFLVFSVALAYLLWTHAKGTPKERIGLALVGGVERLVCRPSLQANHARKNPPPKAIFWG